MKKKSILATTFLTLFLVGCSGSKKVKSIIEFTPQLVSESAEAIYLNQNVAQSINFTDPTNFVNNNQQPIDLLDINQKALRKFSIAKHSLACWPIVNNKIVYHLDVRGNLTATNLEDKKAIWTALIQPSKAIIGSASLVADNKNLYVIADNELVVIDIQTGKEIIRKTLDDLVRNQPVIKNNAFVIQNVSNQLMAYNTDNWQLAWVHETWPEMLSSNRSVAPMIMGQQVIAGYTTGQLVNINAMNGQELWQFNLAREAQEQLGFAPVNLACQPLIDGKYLYVASNNNYLLKIDTSTAQIIWQRELNDVQSMSHSGNTLFITTNGRQIAALSKNDSKVIWTTSLYNEKDKKPTLKPSFFFTPLVTQNGILVISKEGVLYRLDTISGAMVEQYSIPKNVDYFAISGKQLLLFENNKLYTIQLQSLFQE